MSSRKERIDQLVEHARKILSDNQNFDRPTIYASLNEYMINQWRTAKPTREDYIESIATILKGELNKRDCEVGYFAHPDAVSKESYILRTISELGYQRNGEAEAKVLLDVLFKSGQFDSEIDAKKHFELLKRQGLIYERRPGYWAKA